MNVQRFDLGHLVWFINIFTGNAGAKYSHHHEDLLSYVLYDHGREILIDPGRPSYLKPSDFYRSERHNGIWCRDSMLRPVARFFTPRAFMVGAIELSIQSDGNAFHAHARNRRTGVERSLAISGSQDQVRVVETWKKPWARGRYGFTHCFANQPLTQQAPNNLSFLGLDFTYGAAISVSPSERAIAYAEPDRAHRVFATPEAGEITWTLQRRTIAHETA